MKNPGRILIIGGGPTGLGAAYRLQELGYKDFTLLEQTNKPGGLASSIVDARGFTWDMGVHVQYSHYSYYDKVLERAKSVEWLYHLRESWVWVKQRFIPYPFQYNIHLLDPIERDKALNDLKQVSTNSRHSKPDNFHAWIEQTFGRGIADIFMLPYNQKAWGFPLEKLGTEWIGERVAIPDIGRIERNIRENKNDMSWGPNNKFKVPKFGGTGALWKTISSFIEPAKMLFGKPVRGVKLDTKEVVLASGEKIPYDSLLTTIPLDTFCKIAEGLTSHARQAAERLIHSSVYIIGVGLRGKVPEHIKTKNWMYFPEPGSPYYRVTIFSNCSPQNVPEGGEYWSLLAEVSDTPMKPVDGETLQEATLEAMKRDGLIPFDGDIVSYWSHRLEHGYPTPFLGRDEVLNTLFMELQRHEVYSRGRFGGWKYEVSNQDHSFMQGVEWANRILTDEPEVTLMDPRKANSGVFLTNPIDKEPAK